MKINEYDRTKVYEYARKWAYNRNPYFYDFSNIGGDCTNFASQCIYAGSAIMNFTPIMGWFYKSLNERTPSWTGVEFLYNFIIKNNGVGPFGNEIPIEQLEVGDIIQLGRATGDFYHSPVVVGNENGRIYVAAHSYDTFYTPLATFSFDIARGIHILGVKSN